MRSGAVALLAMLAGLTGFAVSAQVPAQQQPPPQQPPVFRGGTIVVPLTVTVTDEKGAPVKDLNELEFVKGEVWANVWTTDFIARIDPASGRVTGWIDLSGLLDPHDAAGVDVLNGIAYDAAGDRLFVTGKLWPKVFEVRLVPSGNAG